MADWILRIGDTEHRTQTLDDLREWRRQGRIPDGSYIYHPVLERWLYAREVEELKDLSFSPQHSSAPRLSSPTSEPSNSNPAPVLIACFLVLTVIGLLAKSCSDSRQNARNARAAEEEAIRNREEKERFRADAERKRSESLAALSSTSLMPASEISRLCDQLGALDGVPASSLRKCADAHVAAAGTAVKEKNFAGASALADRAQSEGATAEELESVRRAIKADEDAVRAKLKAEQRREEARKKAALLNMIRKRDKLENTTWYRDNTSPAYNNRNGFFLYFGEKDSSVWLRWRVQYAADDWLFIQSFTVYVDGVPYEYNAVAFERDNDSDIWEWYDTSPIGTDLDMIRAVIKSKEAVIRFEGRQYRADRKITSEQKRALQRVLDAYAAKGGS